MKVLVFAHRLEIGGSQTNAVDLAASVRARFGHEMVVFATPGPAQALVERRGLRYLAAPTPRAHPSPKMVRALHAACRVERPDLVHAWDWPQCLDAFFGPHLTRGLPLVGSNMQMTVQRGIPRTIPLTEGTEELATASRRSRPGPVLTLEPPVDTTYDDPGAVDPDPFVREHDLDSTAIRLVVVSRLVGFLKLEGIERTIHAVERLGNTPRVQLVVVGDGTAAPTVRGLADGANLRLGRRAVVMAGALTDPRPAYAASDLVVGMGGSSLRAMAFGKATVVLGEQGFSEVFSPSTADRFLWQGFYGLGDGVLDPDPLVRQLAELADDPARRDELGRFARGVVVERFSLSTHADRLEAFYRAAVERGVDRRATAREAVRVVGWRAASRLRDAAEVVRARTSRRSVARSDAR